MRKKIGRPDHMQTKDHLALGLGLLAGTQDEGLEKHKRAFLFGCVEPDFNPLTYLRGYMHEKRFRGHNAENSRTHIHACMERLCLHGLCSAYSYFTLGAMLHYVADSFTFPHNAFFQGTIHEHREYESRLHQVFSGKNHMFGIVGAEYCQDPWNFLLFEHRRYGEASPSLGTDYQYIVRVCACLLSRFLQPVRAKNALGGPVQQACLNRLPVEWCFPDHLAYGLDVPYGLLSNRNPVRTYPGPCP